MRLGVQAVSEAVSSIAPYALLVDGSTCTFMHIAPRGQGVPVDEGQMVEPEGFDIEHCTVHVENTAVLMQMLNHLLRNFDRSNITRWPGQSDMKEPCATVTNRSMLAEMETKFKAAPRRNCPMRTTPQKDTESLTIPSHIDDSHSVEHVTAYSGDCVPKAMHDVIVPWSACSDSADVRISSATGMRPIFRSLPCISDR